MKRIIAIFLLCLFALLLIAARPRPCKTRSECFFRSVYTPTLTATQAATETQAPPVAPPEVCDTSYPYPYIAGTCAHATLESVLATWEVDYPSYPSAIAPPTGYPLPVTSSPTDYP